MARRDSELGGTESRCTRENPFSKENQLVAQRLWDSRGAPEAGEEMEAGEKDPQEKRRD